MLGYIPNIKLQLNKALLQKFFQSKTKNDSVKTPIKTCCNQNSVQIENHMK